MLSHRSAACVVVLASLFATESAKAEDDPAALLRERYAKHEASIPMRDGVRLFTAIYTPRERDGAVPLLLLRTPYGLKPYGEEAYPEKLGPSPAFHEEGEGRRAYAFALQDVRGRYMSEGTFVDMRPHVADKRGGPARPREVDESTDTWDTIEWLLTNVEGLNGRVGMWGISYPGFYAAAGMIDAHPALVAVSPQAPIADWWFDDFHHHGAFFLPHCFNFFASFGQPRPAPTTESAPRFEHGTEDGYAFFLELGGLGAANERHFHGEVATWNDMVAHPNYDEFWRARNLLPHLKNVAPAVLTVGGWYDAEDLYGPLQIYRAIEKGAADSFNALVMGPWRHGGWARDDGDKLGIARFGSKTSEWYRAQVELPFFEHHLRGGPDPELPEATMFETGRNCWRSFETWPPAAGEERVLYARSGGRLEMAPAGPDEPAAAHDAFVSDPARPVPFTQAITTDMTREYMTDDQRFASRRPDVLSYRSEPLEEAITIAGPLVAELWVSTSRQDADWVVKLIDVFPPDAPDAPEQDGFPDGFHLGGAETMVRSEVIRGRFRNDKSRPEPFQPDVPTPVALPLQDVLHTFEPGHRIMVQVQSTWFPLVDRNPQAWVDNVFEARDEDFAAATHRVFRSAAHPTRLRFTVLPE